MDADLNVEFGKFLAQLDLEKNIRKQILFVQGDYYVRDARSFYQYVLDKSKLVTLIGEWHNIQFGCNNIKEVTIADYCFHEVNRNKKCLVLLEYNSGEDPSLVRSVVINKVYNTLKKAGKQDQIFPYDFRPWFLPGGLQEVLYSDKNIPNYTRYIDPFYKATNNDGSSPFLLNSSEYTRKNLQFMQNYYAELDMEFKRLSGLHMKNPHCPSLRDSFKKVWASVCDYFVMRELLKANNPFDDFIIISGEKHRENLTNKLDLVDSHLLTQQYGEPNKCVNLFQTYYI